jgi:hypothetical protein
VQLVGEKEKADMVRERLGEVGREEEAKGWLPATGPAWTL